jgi:hypothetical protein
LAYRQGREASPVRRVDGREGLEGAPRPPVAAQMKEAALNKPHVLLLPIAGAATGRRGCRTLDVGQFHLPKFGMHHRAALPCDDAKAE